MANAAKAAGLKTFGISDHWVMLTENRPSTLMEHPP